MVVNDFYILLFFEIKKLKLDGMLETVNALYMKKYLSHCKYIRLYLEHVVDDRFACIFASPNKTDNVKILRFGPTQMNQ